MAQFDVHRNPNRASAARVPWLLDVQTDLLADIDTRVMVPLTPAVAGNVPPNPRAAPVVTVDGQRYVALVPQLASLPARTLGPAVASLAGQRAELLAALDLLFTGI